MTIIYKPVPIESAEQAEALPDGTVVVGYPRHDPDETTLMAEVKDHGRWSGEYPNYESNDSEVVGLTALVPIEAEEEFQDIDAYEATGHMRRHHLTRYTTPWEEA